MNLKHLGQSIFSVALSAVALFGSWCARSADIIVDNSAASDVVQSGSWNVSSFSPQRYGADYLYDSTGTATKWVAYTPQLTAGEYDAYLWWNSASDRASDAPVIIKAGGQRHYLEADMRSGGGQWVHIGRYAFTATKGLDNAIYVKNQRDNGAYASGIVIADAAKFAPATNTPYRVRLDVPKQTIWGLGVEIQSDSIGSGNNGLPQATTSVPHDLVPSERLRLATDLIGRGYGFRYMRLAGGLYYRGLTADRKNLRERWPEQLDELSTLISTSGLEGVAFEYWSPPTYWKENDTYLGGSLKSFSASFLNEFGDAVVGDIRYLVDHGVPVVEFGLQNEPPINVTNYSHAQYSDSEYVTTFNIVAPKVKAAFPNIRIHANSWNGQGSATIRNGLDPNAVDAWTWHRIGNNSNDQIDNASMFTANRSGKPVYNNEFEYLDNVTSESRMINTAQSVMNWFTFVDSPTWYWLHALKPTYNAEAQGYALGYWRPHDDDDFSKFLHIQQGHFDYELRNWRALVGFLEWMPWNSLRYQLDEPFVRRDQRVLAFRQGGPSGKLVIVLTNRGLAPFTFDIDPGLASNFTGYRYSLTNYRSQLPSQAGVLKPTVPSMAIEFWVEH